MTSASGCVLTISVADDPTSLVPRESCSPPCLLPLATLQSVSTSVNLRCRRHRLVSHHSDRRNHESDATRLTCDVFSAPSVLLQPLYSSCSEILTVVRCLALGCSAVTNHDAKQCHHPLSLICFVRRCCHHCWRGGIAKVTTTTTTTTSCLLPPRHHPEPPETTCSGLLQSTCPTRGPLVIRTCS